MNLIEATQTVENHLEYMNQRMENRFNEITNGIVSEKISDIGAMLWEYEAKDLPAVRKAISELIEEIQEDNYYSPQEKKNYAVILADFSEWIY